MSKKVEDVINRVLSGEAQRNALELVAYIRAKDSFPISQHDKNDESGWNAEGLGFIVFLDSADFPAPWTMWLGADKLGESLTSPIDESVKEFVWSFVAPCGSCGGDCTPGKQATIFEKVFENTCQANLMFHNPNAETINGMKKIIDVKADEIIIV
jgi:hypothetical protein